MVKELKCRVYCHCYHCGERYCGSSMGACNKSCANCRIAEGRKSLDEENKKIFADRGMEFNCKVCT